MVPTLPAQGFGGAFNLPSLYEALSNVFKYYFNIRKYKLNYYYL